MEYPEHNSSECIPKQHTAKVVIPTKERFTLGENKFPYFPDVHDDAGQELLNVSKLDCVVHPCFSRIMSYTETMPDPEKFMEKHEDSNFETIMCDLINNETTCRTIIGDHTSNNPIPAAFRDLKDFVEEYSALLQSVPEGTTRILALPCIHLYTPPHIQDFLYIKLLESLPKDRTIVLRTSWTHNGYLRQMTKDVFLEKIPSTATFTIAGGFAGGCQSGFIDELQDMRTTGKKEWCMAVDMIRTTGIGGPTADISGTLRTLPNINTTQDLHEYIYHPDHAALLQTYKKKVFEEWHSHSIFVDYDYFIDDQFRNIDTNQE